MNKKSKGKHLDRVLRDASIPIHAANEYHVGFDNALRQLGHDPDYQALTQPMREINHYLKELSMDQRHRGVPEMGILFAQLLDAAQTPSALLKTPLPEQGTTVDGFLRGAFAALGPQGANLFDDRQSVYRPPGENLKKKKEESKPVKNKSKLPTPEDFKADRSARKLARLRARDDLYSHVEPSSRPSNHPYDPGHGNRGGEPHGRGSRR